MDPELRIGVGAVGGRVSMVGGKLLTYYYALCHLAPYTLFYFIVHLFLLHSSPPSSIHVCFATLSPIHVICFATL